jgi:tRNA-specific 2-thiouridylase
MVGKRDKVLVGMSGGVDSSVSSALLKMQGFDVRGVFLKLWKTDGEKGDSKALLDAKKIAKILKIPLEIVDIEKKFKKEVVGYFLKEYNAGRTPNPCIFCNENLKFKILFDLADELKIDYVATGHYAQIKNQELRIKNQEKNKKKYCRLLEAKDKSKDQSYFLYRLKQEQLSRLVFPLGKYEKTEVKKLAEKLKLPIFKKTESQDVCFLGGVSVEAFLRKNIKLKKGKIVDIKGKFIGEHAGLPLYTLGQRKGINIGGTGPHYVVKKDKKKNQLVVTNEKLDLFLFSKFANLEDVNWALSVPKFPAKVLARVRYQSPLISAVIVTKHEVGIMKQETQEAKYEIQFNTPQRAVTPGQSIVFYGKKSEVLGGGIIGED